jgi:hypothetical protein
MFSRSFMSRTRGFLATGLVVPALVWISNTPATWKPFCPGGAHGDEYHASAEAGSIT